MTLILQQNCGNGMRITSISDLLVLISITAIYGLYIHVKLFASCINFMCWSLNSMAHFAKMYLHSSSLETSIQTKLMNDPRV